MSELRRDPITTRTVIIAPERLAGTRLWAAEQRMALDGDMCPFCPGQEHVAGREILAWRPADDGEWLIRVVANRLPALRVESHYAEPSGGLFQSLGGLGAHEVIIETPSHETEWAAMSVEELQRVLWAWRERIRDLRRDVRLKTFLVVKNVGAAAGATLDHPHSQLLALPFVPEHLEDELAAARRRYEALTRCAFCALVESEISRRERVVSHDVDTVAVSAFAARVPFETWILPRRHRAAFDEETDEGLRAVAVRIRDVMRRLDVALTSPSLTVLLHMAPGGEAIDAYHWHLEVLPRLMPVNGLAWDGGIHINPVSPEEATRVLREVWHDE